MGGKLARRIHSFEIVDQMRPDHLAVVHEFGLPIVTALTKHGVADPAAMREIVREIWLGARQEGQRTGAAGALDWLLAQSGSRLSAAGLRRVLADSSLYIVPATPNRRMLDASMAEVSGHNVRVSREEKHRRRFRAAVMASAGDLI